MAVSSGSPPVAHLQGDTGGAANGLWLNDGVWVPRGAVAVSIATEEDLDRIAAGSRRRGGVGSPNVPRPLKDSQSLEALCEWLHGHGLTAMGVVTFTDEYADRFGIHSLDRALDDVWQGLQNVPMLNGRRGFPWKFVMAGEMHRTGRSVPHVHLALEIPDRAMEGACGELWRYFYGSRGRSRFEPMRDVNAATLYGLKDAVKAVKEDPAALRYHLWRRRR